MSDLGWKLLLTALFIAINGFFVAAEFSFVKVRRSRIDALAAEGDRKAVVAQHILSHLDLYLSACQLGITISSLVLGWLAEPAVAELLIHGARSAGLDIAEGGWVRVAALVIALTFITILHMTIGEQAPKVLAIHRAEALTLVFAYPLRIFVAVLKPLIALINVISNGMVRLVGLTNVSEHDESPSTEELKALLTSSAAAGYITPRQRTFGENVLGIVNVEVRHVMIPRVDLVMLKAKRSAEDNLAVILKSGHTRFPWCDGEDFESVTGLVHARDVLKRLLRKKPVDFHDFVRKMPVVPRSQPLGRFIVESQQRRTHCAVVVDEHGTAVGMVFLEDALEEIVGPMQDEFDVGDPVDPRIAEEHEGVLRVPGGHRLAEVADMLNTPLESDAETIGGYVLEQLGRIPETGDTLTIGAHDVTVTRMSKHRVLALEFRR